MAILQIPDHYIQFKSIDNMAGSRSYVSSRGLCDPVYKWANFVEGKAQSIDIKVCGRDTISGTIQNLAAFIQRAMGEKCAVFTMTYRINDTIMTMKCQKIIEGGLVLLHGDCEEDAVLLSLLDPDASVKF